MLRKVCQELKIEVKSFDVQNILNFLKKLKDEDLFPVGVSQSLPKKTSETILSKQEISHLLGDFILKFGSKSEIDLHNLPLLVTQDDNLRRFGTLPEVYPHKWHIILLWKKDHFISYGFQTSENYLLEKNYLQKLTAPILIKHLKEYPKFLPVMPVIEILKFIQETYVEGQHQTRLLYVKQFGELPLIPVKRAGGFHFVPAANVKSVLQKKSDVGEKAIHDVFRTAGADLLNIEVEDRKLVYFAQKQDDSDLNLTYRLNSFFQHCVTVIDRPEETLDWVLGNLKMIDAPLRRDQDNICSLLQSLFSRLQNRDPKLNRVPVIFLGQSHCVSRNDLTDKRIIYSPTFSKDYITPGLEDCVFLDSLNHQTFLSRIGIKHLEVTDVYSQHIIMFLPRMTNKEQITHLKHMYSRCSISLNEKLSGTLFVRNQENDSKYLNGLLLGEKDFHQQVGKKHKLLNKEYREAADNNPEFKQFLVNLGLKHNLDEEDILDHVKEKFVSQKMTNVKEEVDKFLTSLKSEGVWKNEKFLTKISKIKFLPRYYPKWAEKILPFDPDEAISFSGSVENSGSSLCWYVKSCLSKTYATTKEGKEKLNIKSDADIEKDEEMIRDQFSKLCQLVNNDNKLVTSFCSSGGYFGSSSEYKQLLVVMSKFDGNSMKTLGDLPCIYQEKSTTFSTPNMTCQNADEKFEPYLWKFPIALGATWPFFEKIGSQTDPQSSHYQKILETIATATLFDTICDPNLSAIAKESFEKFCEKLQTEKDVQGQSLCLPTEPKNQEFRLKKSTDLVLNDWPELTNIVPDVQFVMKNEHFKKAISKIPVNLRPRRLTDIFETKVDIEGSEVCPDGECFGVLAASLQSENFSEALIRLLMSYQQEGYILPEVSKENFNDLKDYMANLRLDCYKVFKVNLIDKRTNTILEGKIESKKSAMIESNAERTILATDHSNITSENGFQGGVTN